MTLNVRCCTQLWCCSLFFLSLSRRAVYYSHTRTLLSKCISNAGLLASTVAHTAMAPLSFLLLPLTSCYLLQSHTHTTQLTFCSATSSVCSRHFETNNSYGLFTSVAPTTHNYYYYYNYNNNNNNRQLISGLSICRHFDYQLSLARTVGFSLSSTIGSL